MSTGVASTSLKRKPDDESPSHRSGVPPLPEIRGEILLQILTHRSLRRQLSGHISEDFDNERLAELGAKVLETAITTTLFHRRPLLSGFEILEQRAHILSEDNIDAWVDMYRLRDKVRCIPELVPSLKSSEETRLLFHAYVGGVYKEGGFELVQRWLDGLTNDNTPTLPNVASEAHQSKRIIEPSRPPPYIVNVTHANPPPPQKRVKSDIFFAAQPPQSSAPAQMPQPISPAVFSSKFGQPQHPAMVSKFANPLSPAQPNLAFLPLFNQTASQRRVTIEYPAEFSGPSHAGTWTVKCVVNGIQKGLGTGQNKQIAKEEASRQAWFSLGWS
ncbi:hypothetical protein D9757_004582 [Collybiopsis confluens]|uniref:Uncharacterized protein n=1 Tax=Collybiopsis confluens TaxID=2823264 RepID=A0A8H5HS36_9AGAR|nr:hypothetical protein D9757_004582 [Collybiopsis confluens]